MRHKEEPKTRYGITHFSTAWNARVVTSFHWVYDTKQEAEQALKDVLENNSKDRLLLVFPDHGKSAKVTSILCYQNGQPIHSIL